MLQVIHQSTGSSIVRTILKRLDSFYSLIWILLAIKKMMRLLSVVLKYVNVEQNLVKKFFFWHTFQDFWYSVKNIMILKNLVWSFLEEFNSPDLGKRERGPGTFRFDWSCRKRSCPCWSTCRPRSRPLQNCSTRQKNRAVDDWKNGK
jgi:hypothetical protein